jgi:hypothetical protein
MSPTGDKGSPSAFKNIIAAFLGERKTVSPYGRRQKGNRAK